MRLQTGSGAVVWAKKFAMRGGQSDEIVEVEKTGTGLAFGASSTWLRSVNGQNPYFLTLFKTVGDDSVVSYWLEVKDEKGCSGRDTIKVHPKPCIEGLYVPSAFTPNHDGRNDVFKAHLFGNVKRFELTIYNRWGQVVFTSKDPAKRWDGRDGQKNQDAGIYAWTCLYQLQGEEVRTEKGMVTVVY